MKNWKGTTDEVRIYGVGVDDHGGKYNCVGTDSDPEQLIGEYGVSLEDCELDLLVDSINTIQKCDLLPSELLERCNEAVNLIKGMKLSMQANPSFNPEGGEFFDFVESAEELIKKHESC